MAKWNTGSLSLSEISIGSVPNDGQGDTIRDAFLKTRNDFDNLSLFLTAGSDDHSTDFYILRANVFTGVDYTNLNNTFVANALITNANITANVTAGNINAGSINTTVLTTHTIRPVTDSVYDIGSPDFYFNNLYIRHTISGGTVSSVDAGQFYVHTHSNIGDLSDVGLFGNITNKYGGVNTYTFFGYQHTTDNFVYKIINNDITVGNGIAVGGTYGNVQFGAALLSNTTPSTSTSTGTLVVGGGAGFGGNVNIGGNVTFGNAVAYGGPVLTANTIGLYGTPYNNTLFGGPGNVLFTMASPSVSTLTGALVVPLGGIGVGGNINAGAVYSPTINGTTVNGTTTNATTLNVSGTSYLNQLQVTTTAAAVSLSATDTSYFYKSTGNGVIVSANIFAGGIVGPWYGVAQTAAQPNITSVGSLTSLTVAGTITSGNITAGNVSATKGTLTGLTISGNLASTSTIYGLGLYDTGNRVLSTSAGAGNLTISGSQVNLTTTGPGAVTVGSSTAIPIITTDVYGRVNASSTAAVIAPAGTLSGTTLNSTVTASSLTSVGTLTGLTVSGTIAASTNNNINIGASGSVFATVYATTFSGVSTTAKYADLAEKYTSDAVYEPGTVVVFGGDAEITVTNTFADVSVAGAISTDPAYLMNAMEDGLPVALRGRIPVKVIGPVTKGDLLVTAEANPGYATSVGRSTEYPLAVFAKAIETNTAEGTKVITAVIL